MIRSVDKPWPWFLMSILLFFGQTFGLAIVSFIGLIYFLFQFLELQSLVDQFFKATTQQAEQSLGQRYGIYALLSIVFLLLSLAFSSFIARLSISLFVLYHTVGAVIALIQLWYVRRIYLLKQTRFQWVYRFVLHSLFVAIAILKPEWFNFLLATITLLIGFSLIPYLPITLRKWPVPLWITFLAPFQQNRKAIKNKKQFTEKPTVLKQTPLSIYIHLEHVNGGQFAHIDVGFEGKVYAYNNFDPDSWRLGRLVGDGVLAVANEEDYLNFRRHHHSTTWIYHANLTPQQLNRVEDFFEDILSQTKPFILTSARQTSHAVGKLSRWGHTNIYKFKSQSKYQTYFLLGMNCAQFVDDLITKAKLDVFTTFGLQTPGNFYYYLELQKIQHPHSFESWDVLQPHSFYQP